MGSSWLTAAVRRGGGGGGGRNSPSESRALAKGLGTGRNEPRTGNGEEKGEEKKTTLKPQRNVNPGQSPGERRVRAALSLAGVQIWRFPPKKACFGAERWPWPGDSQVGGVALGFSLLSCSGGHRPSTTVSVQGPWLWPSAHGCCGRERGAAGLSEVPPTPRSQQPFPSPGSDASFGCLPAISSSTSSFRHKAEIFLLCSIRTKHPDSATLQKKKPLSSFFFCTKPPYA